MEISSKYNPTNIEQKWYRFWLKLKLFQSKPNNKPAYTIVIPPPNVTGVLHMGHMLNNTIQDILIRRARLQGKNALWLPGTDHASIATEAKVVAKLRQEGIEKKSISRENFLKHAWEWKEKHGGIILEQLKKLGASCDWERTKFTMDESLSKSVIKVFIDLYEKGYIYRGNRMVNWDPQAQTAISDEEVIFKEEKSKLYYLKYQIENSDNEYITVATTRPETILGDTAVCFHPDDIRFKHLKNKKCLVPLINRPVPIIEDDYVDMAFGTGCLKITPAHDTNDFEVGLRHNLPIIDIFTSEGKLNEKAQILIGEDRFEARKKIIPLLKNNGNLVKTEDYTNKVGYSERTNIVIEPRLSKQWFLKMEELAKPALKNVLNDSIQFHPSKYKNIYKHWMENIRDWCISRQLWWGHRIPVYYLPNGNYIVAKNKSEALKLAINKTSQKLALKDLKQDDDVLDTWFSSWLWSISVFDGVNNPDNKDFKYYFPTNDLITAPDIIFFWVARMIIISYELTGEKPFKNVYFTGMVRDSQRRKMSKQLGNSPNPLTLIEKHGADALRVGMLLASPAGNDLLYDESLIIQGRNFANKIWNIFRLVNSWDVEHKTPQKHSVLAIEWFENLLSKNIDRLNKQFDQYRISEALMTTYTLLKDDFSSWFLEIVKPPYKEKIDVTTYKSVISFFEHLLQLLHPFMPFITEEIWQNLNKRKKEDSIMVTTFPKNTSPYDETILKEMSLAQELIVQIRNIRKEHNIPLKRKLELNILNNNKIHLKKFKPIIIKGAVLESLLFVENKISDSITFNIKDTEFYIPIEKKLNIDAELAKLKKEIEYIEGFLKSINTKLSNKHFIENAPQAIISKEETKKTDAETKLKILKNRLNTLTN